MKAEIIDGLELKLLFNVNKVKKADYQARKYLNNVIIGVHLYLLLKVRKCPKENEYPHINDN